jgi:hypothetical protein
MAKEIQNPETEIATTEEVTLDAQEQKVKELKTKFGHKNIYVLSVPDADTDEVLVAYLKKPSRQAISASMSRASLDPLQANEIILNDAWIEGDDRIRSEDNILSALASMQGLMSVKIGELKKL